MTQVQKIFLMMKQVMEKGNLSGGGPSMQDMIQGLKFQTLVLEWFSKAKLNLERQLSNMD
jgi:hypothetical protein